ncbi:MAG: molybdopterin-guanine dinucleotide biosynthesis protein B [Pseudomonadota bacterium]
MSEWPKNAFGIAGWKDTGKTTLVERLVKELTGRGMRVATLKHAHHDFTVDHEGTDSHRHRAAGSLETIVSSARQTVHMTSVQRAEPTLTQLLNRLGAHDIVLAEGWKTQNLPKLMLVDEFPQELYPGTIALVTKGEVRANEMPSFHRDEVTAIADFLKTRLKEGQL